MNIDWVFILGVVLPPFLAALVWIWCFRALGEMFDPKRRYEEDDFE